MVAAQDPSSFDHSRSTEKSSVHERTPNSTHPNRSENNKTPEISEYAKNSSPSLEDMFDDANQTLRDNLSQYAQIYRKTGKIDFIGAEIVARMASEGEVLVPDQAERLMRKIHAAAHHIQQFTLQLQADLQSEVSHGENLPEDVRLNLINLYRETTALLTTVEIHVIPLVTLVQSDWKNELLRLISGLKNTLDNWIQSLGQDDDELKESQVKKNRKLVYQSTLFSVKVEELRIKSLEIIMRRVPLYRVLS